MLTVPPLREDHSTEEQLSHMWMIQDSFCKDFVASVGIYYGILEYHVTFTGWFFSLRIPFQ